MKKLTKAVAISKELKKEVAARDSYNKWPCCVWCGKPAPAENMLAFSNAHYIPRSLGGLGISENILTLCPECHHLYDQTDQREKMQRYFKIYLIKKCPEWDESKLIYRRQ